MARFHPSGIITLTTDFGLSDPFVGVMKGAILSRFLSARIIDLTHEAPAHRPEEAGFWLSRSFEYFPPGTVHVAVVDPGVGTARRIVCMSLRGHALLAPDNGLLARLHARVPPDEVVEVGAQALAKLGIERVSSTFHGRDIFAPVAAELASGRCSPAALGVPLQGLSSVTLDEPDTSGGAIQGRVITVDRFGNLITNIDAALLAPIEDPRVRICERTVRLGRTYGDVPPGEILALVNSFDVLEIARGQGSAAAALGVGPGARVTVYRAP